MSFKKTGIAPVVSPPMTLEELQKREDTIPDTPSRKHPLELPPHPKPQLDEKKNTG